MMKSTKHGSLSYYLPEIDKPHTVLRIPGSHTIFVGPSSCTRRHAFHALEYGDDDHVSFLFVTEPDIISGDYEDLIEDAVGDLLEIIEPAPHIFIIATFCVDDFLGTDEKALLDRLHTAYPNRRFAFDRIDPITLGENPKQGLMIKHMNIFSFLLPEPVHDRGVNFIGHFVSLEPECEFFKVLEHCGAGPVRELFNCKVYEDYQDMAKSTLAIGMRFTPQATREFFTDTLDIPYYYFPTSYSPSFIAGGYTDICRLLGCSAPDFTEEIRAAEEDGRTTAQALRTLEGGITLAIDATAFIMTFTTARALLDFGFDLKYIFHTKHMIGMELEACERIKAAGEPRIFRDDDFSSMNMEDLGRNCLAIGPDGHRIMKTRWFADVWHDEGYYGFHGIHRLMALIRKTVGLEPGLEKFLAGSGCAGAPPGPRADTTEKEVK